MRRIGFVGIGNMGWPMAANLARAGFELAVFDALSERGREFAAAHGAECTDSLASLAGRSQCVITMLPNHDVVRAVALGTGADSLIAGLAAGSIVADMSTSDPTATRALGAELARRDVHLVDAPVMGGVPFARDATLDIMAGGASAQLDALEPVFAVLGRKVYRCGALGSGHALKAINNYINACTLINVVEGMTIGAKFGIDTAMMVETMQAMCTGRNHPIDKKVIPQVLTRKYATAMPLSYNAKDLRIAVDEAHRHGAAAPLAEKVLELWQAAAAALGGQCDQAEVVRYWESRSGVEL
jgi:3-hydroxyisobutyrate dehydrogenase